VLTIGTSPDGQTGKVVSGELDAQLRLCSLSRELLNGNFPGLRYDDFFEFMSANEARNLVAALNCLKRSLRT
jgi:hypothetical protein